MKNDTLILLGIIGGVGVAYYFMRKKRTQMFDKQVDKEYIIISDNNGEAVQPPQKIIEEFPKANESGETTYGKASNIGYYAGLSAGAGVAGYVTYKYYNDKNYRLYLPIIIYKYGYSIGSRIANNYVIQKIGEIPKLFSK